MSTKPSVKTPATHHADATCHAATHTYRNDVVLRLSRVIGHLEAVRRMVEEDRECIDVLLQIAAVKSALASCSRIVLAEHISSHVVEAAGKKDLQPLQDLGSLIDRIMK